jgi:hypothetical protein
MDVVDRTNNAIDTIRCPVIEGLSSETVAMLHKSLVDIVHLRRSLERTRLQVTRSSQAAFESAELLRRLRLQGF